MSEEQKQDTNVDAQVQATEKEARLLGWVPKEDFRDGDAWVDAETFVKRGKEINPILRKNNEILLKKLETATQEIAEVKKAAKEFEKFQKEQADRKVKEITNQLEVLKQSRKDAITSGDGEAVVAIEEQMDELKAEKQTTLEEAKAPVEEPQAKTQVLDPLVVAWMDKNEWFGVDRTLTVLANEVGAQLNQKNPNLRGEAFFEALDEALVAEFPEKFGKKERANPIEGTTKGSNRPVGGSAKSYKNLPADAKQACDRFVRQGFMTQEDYVRDYDWS
jgi:cytochrome c556